MMYIFATLLIMFALCALSFLILRYRKIKQNIEFDKRTFGE